MINRKDLERIYELTKPLIIVGLFALGAYIVYKEIVKR